MREVDEFTFTRVNMVCRNSLDLQLLGIVKAKENNLQTDIEF